MNPMISRITLASLLAVTLSANAAEVLLPNGDFTAAGGSEWGQSFGGNQVISYPDTGGNPGGYASIVSNEAGGYAVLISNNDQPLPLSSLGLVAGKTYTFSYDMIASVAGANKGGMKFESWSATAGISNSGDRRVTAATTGWATYTYDYTIDAAATHLKVVPLWTPNETVGFDNIKVNDTPVGPPPVVPGIPNPGFETPGGASWTQVGPITGFSYPTTGGNPGGYGVMDASNGQWGIWVANSDAVLTLEQLSLTAGKTYNFTMDMKLLSGTAIGGFKVDFFPSGSTGNIYPSIIGDGSNWATYTFPVAIPAGTTSVKLVPLWGPSSVVGYDNIAVNTTPVVPPPIIPVVTNGDFEIAGGASWSYFNDGPTISYPTTGGNPSGHAVIDATVGGNYGVLVAFNNTEKTAVSLGLTPGETYTFQVDMKILDGTGIGGLRLEGPNGFAVEQRPAIIGDGTEWATYSIPFTLQNGLNPVTQFKLVALWGINSKVAFDNFKILLPAPAGPLQAMLTTGTTVSWTATSAVNRYQPQESSNGTTWTNLGAPVIGNAASAVFDDSKSPFYQVLESVPAVKEVVYNANFTEEGFDEDEAEGWNPVQSQWPTRLATGGRTDNGACMQIQVFNSGSDANGSEIQQNTKNVDPLNGVITPGNTYDFSFWAKQISSGVSYVQQYKISWLDDSGAIRGDGGVRAFSAPVGGAWTQITQPGLVAPAGATTALIQILGVTGAVEGGLGEVLIDDVSLLSSGFGAPNVPPLAATATPTVEISWQSKTGQDYQVQSSSNLTGWSNFGGVIPGDGSIKAVYDSMVDPKKFYRVGELP